MAWDCSPARFVLETRGSPEGGGEGSDAGVHQRGCRRGSAAGCSPEPDRCLRRSLAEALEALEVGGGNEVVGGGASVRVGVTEDRQEGMIAQSLWRCHDVKHMVAENSFLNDMLSAIDFDLHVWQPWVHPQLNGAIIIGGIVRQENTYIMHGAP